MDWQKLMADLQALGVSQAEIARHIGKSQGWVSAVATGKYIDVKWSDGEALRKFHEGKGRDAVAVSPGNTAPAAEAA